MGLLEARYKFNEEILSEEEATVLANALNHQYYKDADGLDKYFTSEEYKKPSLLIVLEVNRPLIERGINRLPKQGWKHSLRNELALLLIVKGPNIIQVPKNRNPTKSTWQTVPLPPKDYGL